MPFDVESPKKKLAKSSTDDMVELARVAASRERLATTRIRKKEELPREARIGFAIGLGFLLCMVVLAFVKLHG